MYGRMDPVCPFFAFYLLEEVAEVIRPDMLVVSITMALLEYIQNQFC